MIFKILILFLTLTPRLVGATVSFEGLQAAYVHKFTNYIEWPKHKNHKFIVAVLRNPELYQAMKEQFDGKMVDNRTVVVLNIKKLDKNEKYDILHIKEMDPVLIKEVDSITEQDVLLISQDPDGLNDNVTINFFLESDGKLRFDININMANQNHLKINSRLLNLARNLK